MQNQSRAVIRPSMVSILLLTATVALANTPPTVSNVVASQRPGTFLVDITYDLADAENDACVVSLLLSTDAGLTYPVSLVSLVGDAGAGLMPGVGKAVVWDAGADAPEFYSTECSIRVVAEDAAAADVTLVVLLDRSGSMSGVKFDNAVTELGTFFLDPGTDGVSAGMNFFPVGGVPDECDTAIYDPLQVPAVAIPADANDLLTAMSGQAALGSATTYPALMGSLMFAMDDRDTNPTETLAVVLVTDGGATACTMGNSELVSLALGGFQYNGTLTYVVALQGASVSDMNAIASAGGTVTAYDATSDILLLSELMVMIAADAASR